MPKTSRIRRSRKSSSAPSKRPKANASPSAAIVKRDQTLALTVSEPIEKVLIQGDLSPLTPQERLQYYKAVCSSLGLNPLTRPFDYILFRESDGGPAKLSLYANKSCTEQLRKIHGVSIIPPFRKSRTESIVTVEVDARDKTGRTDTASGSVPLFRYKDGQRIEFSGKELCNAEMKCETKAKRRVTLSICGLAILDESELDTMEVVGGVTPDGRIYRYVESDAPQTGREAARHVLEEKLAGRMPLNPPDPPATAVPHPTPSGKPKGKIAESEYHPENIPPAVPPEPWKYAGSIEFDYSEDATFPRITGEIGELIASFPKDLTLKRKDDFWHCFAEDAERIKTVAVSKNFEIKILAKPKSPAVPQREPAKPKGAAISPSGAVPSAGPELFIGIIQQANPESGKVPRVSVLLKVEKKSYWMSTFDTALFPPLIAGKDKAAEVYVKETTKGDKTYKNIVGLKRVGATEYDDDGKTPVIQNRDREAGGRTLFP